MHFKKKEKKLSQGTLSIRSAQGLCRTAFTNSKRVLLPYLGALLRVSWMRFFWCGLNVTARLNWALEDMAENSRIDIWPEKSPEMECKKELTIREAKSIWGWLTRLSAQKSHFTVLSIRIQSPLILLFLLTIDYLHYHVCVGTVLDAYADETKMEDLVPSLWGVGGLGGGCFYRS